MSKVKIFLVSAILSFCGSIFLFVLFFKKLAFYMGALFLLLIFLGLFFLFGSVFVFEDEVFDDYYINYNYTEGVNMPCKKKKLKKKR